MLSYVVSSIVSRATFSTCLGVAWASLGMSYSDFSRKVLGNAVDLIITFFDTNWSSSGSWRWNGFCFSNSGNLDRDSTEFERRLEDKNCASELLSY